MGAIIAFILITVVSQAISGSAAVSSGELYYLKLRASRHPEFLRIVLEGTEPIVSKGIVNKKGKDILVSFPDTNFTLQEQKVAIAYQIDKNLILFSPGNFSEFKVFSLKNPSRLVIDVYLKAKKKETKPPVEVSEKTHMPIPPFPPLSKEEKGGFSEQGSNNYSFVTEKYKKVWDLLKSDNPYRALKELSGYKPEDIESLAIYHFTYGETYTAMKDYLAAIEHYSLASVYADNDELKELALFKRAELYLKLGLTYEAKANYLIFIKNFPSSRYIARAHLGLAKSLTEIGLFRDAIEHYKKADKEPEALFGIANALQRLGRVKEARTAYVEAMLVDKTYPEMSPETYYLIGENMRMAGEKADARRYLRAIKSGPFKDSASISLGLIAMKESNTEDAIKNFKSAVMSKDRELKVQALLNLSTALLKTGKVKEAISTLEEIRYKHSHTSLYKKSLFELSKIYRKDGKFKEAVSLLKELVYGQSPPIEVFNELEVILLEARKKAEKGAADEAEFVNLWNNVGQWLLDGSREQFLLKMVKAIKHKGKPFLYLSTWLVENASEEARTQAAITLADFYAEMGNANTAKKYLGMVMKSKKSSDAVMRIEAKIHRAAGDLKSAVAKLMLIKKFEKSDLDLFGSVISESKDAQKAIDFYEKAINRLEGDSEDYIRLADILYDNNRKDDALKYYRIAYKKGTKDEWAMYRIGILIGLQEYKLPQPDKNKQTMYRIGISGGRKEAEEMFSHLQKGDSTLSRIAKTKLMEMDILNRVARVF